MALASNIGKSLIAAAPALAPAAVGGLLRRIVDAAINGTGPLPAARTSAGHHLEKHAGDVEKAIDALVYQHVAMGGAQGFVTNLGGFATAVASIPANLTGVAVVQSRMVACIAHLRGYDLDDSRVRAALLMTLLGRNEVDELVGQGVLPSTPMGVATSPALDAALEQQIAEKVVTSLMARIGGKQTVAFIGKRIPVIGGGVGGIADGYTTLAISRYARQQFVSRRTQIQA